MVERKVEKEKDSLLDFRLPDGSEDQFVGQPVGSKEKTTVEIQHGGAHVPDRELQVLRDLEESLSEHVSDPVSGRLSAESLGRAQTMRRIIRVAQARSVLESGILDEASVSALRSALGEEIGTDPSLMRDRQRFVSVGTRRVLPFWVKRQR